MPQFRDIFEVTDTAEYHPLGKGFTYQVKDRISLYQRNRIAWCLFHLTEDENEFGAFELTVVLEHLEDYIRSCTRDESRMMTQGIYACVSDLAAITHMLATLSFHRPYFPDPSIDELEAFSPEWKLCERHPATLRTNFTLSSKISPLDKFEQPKGRKDEKWLKASDAAHQSLKDVWRHARGHYNRI